MYCVTVLLALTSTCPNKQTEKLTIYIRIFVTFDVPVIRYHEESGLTRQPNRSEGLRWRGGVSGGAQHGANSIRRSQGGSTLSERRQQPPRRGAHTSGELTSPDKPP